MVLINDKKFACATCIKGHRVSGCTHADRPLFEVKKKGRPSTQCACCREKRKGSVSSGLGNGAVHNKCVCGAEHKEKERDKAKSSSTLNLPETFPPPRSEGSYAHSTSSSDHSPTPTPHNGFVENYETRKGVPGSSATFPNGLKDVHDMAAAAEALSGMGGADEVMQVAQRKVAHLLNPCHCKSGGICKCCLPKREKSTTMPMRSTSPHSSGALTPSRTHGKSTGHNQVTDSLIEMFRSKATTTSTPPEPSLQPKIYQGYHSSNTHSNVSTLFLSPDNMHHPAHTSPHVHKTKLYSPYSTSGHSSPRHALGRSSTPRSGWASTHHDHTKSPPPPRIRPLADMNTFLGAVFKEDGTLASEIPRSALGLPGIKAFDRLVKSGAVKVEDAIFEDVEGEGEGMEVDVPVLFPTTQDVVIGACTCGEDCECAGCATHPANKGSIVSHGKEHPCGENCKSCFNCADHLSLPSGITSIQHLLSLAAANVPLPHPVRSIGTGQLNAHDTRVLPPAVGISEEARLNMGLVSLKPLECCNGRCQCRPGECTCEKTCCGCCVRCACDEDGDERMGGEGGCGTKGTQEVKGDCCKDKIGQVQVQNGLYSPTVLISPTVELDESIESAIFPTHTTLTNSKDPRHASSTSRTSSSSGTITPNRQELPPSTSSTLRRAGSITHGPPNARRSSGTSIQRSASTGKSASKALALHQAPHHPQIHHRPILPKPPSNPSVGAKSAGNGGAHVGALGNGTDGMGNLSAVMKSRSDSLIRANSSGSSSRTASPALPGVQGAVHALTQTGSTIPNMNGYTTTGNTIASGSSSGSNPSVAQLIPNFSQHSFFPNDSDYTLPPDSSTSASAAEMDVNSDMTGLVENGDFMAYLTSIGLGGDTPIPIPEFNGGDVGGEQGITPDLAFDGVGSGNVNGDEGGREFYELLARAMAGAGGGQGGDGGSERNAQAVGADLREAVDYGWSFTPFDYRATGQPTSRIPSPTGIPGTSNIANSTDPMTAQLPGQGQFSDPTQTPSSILHQIQSTPQPTIDGSVPSPRPGAAQLQVLQQALNNGISSSANSNLIDLSKPLDADDVERIIRALQAQQQDQQPGSTSQPPMQNQRIATEQPIQNPSHSMSGQDFQVTLPSSLGQYAPSGVPTQNGLSAGYGNHPHLSMYAHSSSTHQSSYPPSEASSQYVPLSSASTTGEMDDMFDRFVFDPNLVRDATGDGFDVRDTSGLFAGEEDWSQFGNGLEVGLKDSSGQGWKEDGEGQNGILADLLRSSSGI